MKEYLTGNSPERRKLYDEAIKASMADQQNVTIDLLESNEPIKPLKVHKAGEDSVCISCEG
jgi:hypothetical protein